MLSVISRLNDSATFHLEKSNSFFNNQMIDSFLPKYPEANILNIQTCTYVYVCPLKHLSQSVCFKNILIQKLNILSYFLH